MTAGIKAKQLSLTVPTFIQKDRGVRRWSSLFFGAMFDPPRRRQAHLLKDFTFEIKDGERMALLGQNGAGKSTLLKVLNGAYAPTSGNLEVHGRCQALLNLSIGFSQQATVRENIFLRGTAMGLPTRFLRQHVDDILDFADIPEKVNQRLYTLSSGQRMRLGFAISTVVQQDILLLDEWLNTGDANFKVKAKERLADRVEGSGIVVLASHSAGLLRDICNRGMVIDHGRLLYVGDIEPAIAFYQNVLALQWASGDMDPGELASGRPLVYGYVDGIEVAGSGRVRLRGWMASTTGPAPEMLEIRLDGNAHEARDMARIKRGDVVKRFGVRDEQCGFHADFLIPGVESAMDLKGMAVMGGLPGAAADTALRQSDRVVMAIQSGELAV